MISDAGRFGRVTTGRIASAPTDTNPDTCAKHRSRVTARTPDQSRLPKRRQAIVALMCSGLALFTFFITINVTQALQHGYGLHSGRPRPEAVDTSHGGNGFRGDALVIGVVIPLTLSALIAAAYWLATRGDPPTLLSHRRKSTLNPGISSRYFAIQGVSLSWQSCARS